MRLLVAVVLIAAVVVAQVSEEQAFVDLLQAQEDVVQLQRAGFSTNFVEDELARAERAFQGTNLTEVLAKSTSNATPTERAYALELYTRAVDALEGGAKIDPNYELVHAIAQKIRETKLLAFEAQDELMLVEFEFSQLNRSLANYSRADEFAAMALDAFRGERYEDAMQYAKRARDVAYTTTVESTKLRAYLKAYQRTVWNFVKENVVALLVLLLAIVLLVSYVLFKVARVRVVQEIQSLEKELVSIRKLLKNAQESYFAKGDISKSSYKSKLDCYTQRKIEIESTLPVLKSKLSDLRLPWPVYVLKKLKAR